MSASVLIITEAVQWRTLLKKRAKIENYSRKVHSSDEKGRLLLSEEVAQYLRTIILTLNS